MSKRVKTRAQKDKDRRQSRGPAEIRRDFDIHNAARRIAYQRSQSTEHDIPMYHSDPVWPDTVPSRTLPVSPLLVHSHGLAVRYIIAYQHG
jgi:hypothetical protein